MYEEHFAQIFFSPLPQITRYHPLFELNLVDPESFKGEMPLHMSRLKDLHMLSYLSEKAPFPGDSLKCTGGSLLW